MNYFAHGRRFVSRPYYLAGTAIPDWLSVVDRKVRVRSKSAAKFLDHPDPHVAALASGVVQHHRDDAWFHETTAFRELNWQFAVVLRNLLLETNGFRPSFVGHVLIEVLLDAALYADDITRLDQYYAALDQIDPLIVERAVNVMANRPNDQLAKFIPRFSEARFLYDYLDDGKLLGRLNMVMTRVRLPQLSDVVLEFLPDARRQVQLRKGELLQEPTSGESR